MLEIDKEISKYVDKAEMCIIWQGSVGIEFGGIVLHLLFSCHRALLVWPDVAQLFRLWQITFCGLQRNLTVVRVVQNYIRQFEWILILVDR